MPPRRQLSLAAALGTAVAVAGCVAALGAYLAVAALLQDEGTLAGLLEGFVAGAVVLAVTPVATVAAVRWWAGRGAATGPGWGWATVAVAAGALAAWVVLVAGNALGPPGSPAGTAALIAVAAVVAALAADRVLAAWARSPSRGSGSPPGPAPS